MEGKKRRILTGVLAFVFIVSAACLVWKTMDYHKGETDYEEASALVGADVLAETDKYAEMLAGLDLSALREVNGEVVAWIAIPDTEVFYPVMQAADNRYYLNHTWKGEKSSVGAIFEECENAPDFSGFHTLLYGHQMRNGSMFGGLHQYKEEDYLRAHPAIYLVTDSGVRRYEVFAAFEAGVRDIVYRLDVEKEGAQQELIAYSLSHSVVDTGIVPETDEHILTLSTCTGRGYATRWVVQGVWSGEEAKE